MFNHMPTQQNLANYLKGIVSRDPPNRRKPVHRLIQVFENDDVLWLPDKMASANELLIDSFDVVDGDVVFTGEARTAHAAVKMLIGTYLDMLAGEPTLFGVSEAAEHLGVSERTVRKHIYETKKLDPITVGNGGTMIFTRKRLYEFERSLLPSHRPRKEPNGEPA